MSEAKHTPGPWKVDGGRMQTSTDAWHALISIVRPKGEDVTDPLIAEVYGPTAPGSVLDRDANAQLIAAAPDLLAACVAAKAILNAYIPPDNFDGHAARALIMVRDAIRKATETEQPPAPKE